MSALKGIRLRRRSGRKKGPNPLAVAALTILLAVAITYWAFNGKQIPFIHHFTMYAVVHNSVDIVPQSPVRIAGVNVGQVTGTSAEGALTKIAFTLQSNGLPVHTDATITIRDRLFLEGGYYLALDPGTPSAPIAKDGYQIPLSNTAYPVQFYQLLSTFNSATRTSLENTLNSLDQGFSAPSYCAAGASTQLSVPENPCPADDHPVEETPTLTNSGAGGLKAAAPQLTPTLKDIAWVTQGLRGTQPGDVERFLSSASDVTSTLNASSSQLANFVTSLNEASGALASADGALAQSVSGLDQTLQVAPGALSAVDHSLPPTASLAVALDPSLKVAPPIIEGVTKAVGELAVVVAPVERGKLLDTLKATFVSFPSLLRQLGSVFPITKGVTDCLRTHISPLFDEVVPDGSLSTGQPVWQDFVHFLVGLTSSTQNFDGNGYYTRLIAGTGDNGLSVGQLPGLGAILGSTPGTAGIEGARPKWVGDLTSADFRPDVACTSQPLPSLTATTAAPDLRHVGYAAPASPAEAQKLAKSLGLHTTAVKASGH
jgi:phospholipid/cholesterol/gamma-HCH transport system substrate-binding protein